MKFHATPSLLLAGLLALTGAVHAQTAAGTSDVPAKAGEASTMTQGVPNAKTTNSTASEAAAMSRSDIREDAQGRGKAAATTRTPGRAGEASTMVKGNPNADPDSPMLNKSKSERKAEKEMKKAQRKQEREIAVMGQKGAQAGAEAGTPQISPAGNPSVFKGGTPK
jgi:hypothetical protein